MSDRNDQPDDQQVEELLKQVSDLRRLLMQSQKMSSVGALASSITHEFNNILTTVINYAKLGLRKKDAASRDKAFEKILSAGQRAAKITCGMLSYARDQGDRFELTDLAQLVQEVLVLVEKDLQMHRVKLQVDVFDQPHAMVNAGQIQQVLVNLLVNARQAMDGGGRLFLTIRTNEKDNMAEIAVRDTGTGIPPDKLPKIFSPFFSTKQADKQGQGGTGLGLSLCRDIIEAHKGRIRVESALGKGTTFTLRFPLVENPATSASLAVTKAG